MKYCLVHIPCSDANEAEKISKAILDKKLVACCKLIPITSMYWWKGKIEDSKEVLILAETKSDKFKEIEDVINKLHSYETPVILSIPIENINKNAADWIETDMK
jgi:periplasmic divalent cation tolerance protein